MMLCHACLEEDVLCFFYIKNLDAVSTFKSFPASHKYHILLFVVELVPTSVNYRVFRISYDSAAQGTKSGTNETSSKSVHIIQVM